MREQYCNDRLSVNSEDDRISTNLLTTMQNRLGLNVPEKQPQKSIEYLLQALHSSEWTCRVEAARALEHVDHYVSAAPLVNTLLNDENSFVRAAAARSLGGQKSASLKPQILLALRDPEWRVRAAVIEALSNLEGPQPVETYINVLRDDEDRAVRTAALRALDRLGSYISAEPLLQAQYDNDELIRTAALEMLLKRGIPVALVDLTHVSNNEYKMIQTAASQSTAMFGQYLASLVKGLKDEKKEVQLATAKALIAFGMHTPLQPILEALEVGDETIQHQAISALILFHEQLSQLHFVDRPSIKEESIYTAAVDTLVAFSSAAPLWPLAYALKERDKVIWSVAMEALTKLYETMPEHVYPEFLLYCAQYDEDVVTRATAIEILQEIKDQPTLQRTDQQLIYDEDEMQKQQKRGALDTEDDYQARYQALLQSLARFLKEKQGNVHNTIIGSVGKQTLVLTCNYETTNDSMQASIISSLESSTCIQRFHAALKDQDDVIRHIASHMVEELEKSPYREGLLVSVDLPESTDRTSATPVQLVFCGMSYNEVFNSDKVKFSDHSLENQGNLYMEEKISHVVEQLATACSERWQKNLCERAHEMTGLKLFFKAGEEVPPQDHSWMDTDSHVVHRNIH